MEFKKEDLTKMANAKYVEMPVMRSGVVKYSEDLGVLNVTNEFLEKIAPSAQGNMVVIYHDAIEGLLDDETAEQVVDVGRVIEYFQDGEIWKARFLVDYKEPYELLKDKDWGISTGWVPKDMDKTKGTWNQIEYNATALDGYYEHLAIVPNPRYEMAKGAKFLNSLQPANAGANIKTNNKGVLGMLSIFSKKKDGLVKIGNEVHKVSDMVKYINEKEEEKKKNEMYLNGDDKVMVNGKEMTVDELVECFQNEKKAEASEDDKAENEEDKAENEDKAECSDYDKAEVSDAEENLEDVKENSEDEDKAENEEDKAEASEDDEAKKAENAAKKAENAAKFAKIKNSAATGSPQVIHTQLTQIEKMARGTSKWGS